MARKKIKIVKKQVKKKEAHIKKQINLKTETLHWVSAIVFFVLALFLILTSFHKGGPVGETIFNWFSYLLGIGFFLIPTIFLILGISLTKDIKTDFALPRVFGSFLFVLASLGIVDLISQGEGGIIGGIISLPLLRLFDFSASLIFLIALVIISLLIIFDTSPNFKLLLFKRKEKNNNEDTKQKEEMEVENKNMKMTGIIDDKEEEEETPANQNKKVDEKSLKNILNFNKNKKEKNLIDEIKVLPRKILFEKKTMLPPINILSKDKGKPGVGDIKANANIIKRALYNFGINVEMDEISIGPSVTRYALKPAEGVKLSRIMGLQNDLSLALAAHPLRIEAPIPGKALVGIEIPNSTKTTVGLATLFSSKDFQNSTFPLTIALGKDISGNAHFTNLTKAPHMLIAGSTGSGKSVTIHTIIASLLYRNGPDNLRFIMIDPKRVELTLYKSTPHLLTPVITDPKKAILALKWAVKEMERRLSVLEEKSVRDIQSYRKNIVEPAKAKFIKEKNNRDAIEPELPETMPYIVIIIDELADIMQAYPRELEASIVRLAQMSRAVGIHLILSTQRPSVNVITGLIKANVPTRIALQVASQVDSRTILDMSGAEKLLGAGDMLYMSGNMSKPRRIQAAYISEKEVKDIVKFLKDAYSNEIPDEIDISVTEKDPNVLFEGILDGDLEEEESDDLFESAKKEVLAVGKASTSYLQRKLRIGYSRAARLMDILENKSIIGPANGSKAREVLIKDEPQNITKNPKEETSLGENEAEYLNAQKDKEMLEKIANEHGLENK